MARKIPWTTSNEVVDKQGRPQPRQKVGRPDLSDSQADPKTKLLQASVSVKPHIKTALRKRKTCTFALATNRVKANMYSQHVHHRVLHRPVLLK